MTHESLLTLLQFSDGLFPAGAYAHSFGLETYVQTGRVRTSGDVEEFLRAYLQGAAGPADAVAVVNALRAAKSKDVRTCFEIDATLDAMKPVAELREASRQLGRQTLRVAVALDQDLTTLEFCRMADANATPCHHAVVFGIVGGTRLWSPREAATAYLYSSAAAMVGAALRSIPLGQIQGQLVIRNLAPLIETLSDDATRLSITEMSSFAPALEIAAMRHAQLEARLFRS